ncbi:Aldo-ket-red domain-containing protein [Mycena indigotica]|uniref:Aldo-ket-red domain-containing protein n=1 Tax=Mycena indigotica TaxID=2126181 RepID=A0A8H6W913_9AGAR|nr:Aldo-ket-red domain-containing protein [Mycena indigotica]KAF7310214.1 Aldo-ket-red domain-containing protein [Mycena indigotica]
MAGADKPRSFRGAAVTSISEPSCVFPPPAGGRSILFGRDGQDSFKNRSNAPGDGAPLSADTTGRPSTHSNPLHLPPCPLQYPSSTQKRCPSAGWAPAGCACRSSLSRRLPVFTCSSSTSAHFPAGLTLGGSVVGESVKDIMQAAFENGINMFDTAEDYQKGAAEREMGRAIKELGWRRTDLIISTKIFWSHEPGTGPNDTGLSRKHATASSRARRHACDGCKWTMSTSSSRIDAIPPFRWRRLFVLSTTLSTRAGRSTGAPPNGARIRSKRRIASVFLALNLPLLTPGTDVATRLNLIAPIAEQCKHNMFHRDRPEKEYAPLYAKYGLGTTAFSALQGGLLTGKYNDGIPDGTRFATVPMFRGATEGAQGEELLQKVRLLGEIAAGATELNSTPTALALAWVAAHRYTSTVILGVSSVAQLQANLAALAVLPKLDAAVLARIESVLSNRPQEPETYGRPPLDRGIL